MSSVVAFRSASLSRKSSKMILSSRPYVRRVASTSSQFSSMPATSTDEDCHFALILGKPGGGKGTISGKLLKVRFHSRPQLFSSFKELGRSSQNFCCSPKHSFSHRKGLPSIPSHLDWWLTSIPCSWGNETWNRGKAIHERRKIGSWWVDDWTSNGRGCSETWPWQIFASRWLPKNRRPSWTFGGGCPRRPRHKLGHSNRNHCWTDSR